MNEMQPPRAFNSQKRRRGDYLAALVKGLSTPVRGGYILSDLVHTNLNP